MRWTSPNCPAPPDCFLCTIIGTGCFSDCFTIRDLRLLKLNLQFFVIFQTSTSRYGDETHLVHDTIVCFNSLDCSTSQVGSSSRIRFKAFIIFSVSASFTAFTARVYFGLGYLMKLKRFSLFLSFNVFPGMILKERKFCRRMRSIL